MSRTNVEIEDELIARVMRRHGFESKRQAVDYALRRIDVDPMSREELLAMEGSGWGGDLDEMRQPDPIVTAWIEEQDRQTARGD